MNPVRTMVARCVLAAIVAALALCPGRHVARAQTPPAGYEHFTSGVSVWVDGGSVVVQTTAIPDHKSPYFLISSPLYEAYNGTNPNFQLNPNRIVTQTIEFRLPAQPQVAAAHAVTPLGPIGVAINGVPLFNQYAGPNQPLTNEINSFDQYDGHPQQTGVYHYHVEPLALTVRNGRDSLIGFLLDGFPVYGPVENGVAVTNADLDQYHGHVHATPEYPGGIYHYHFTAEAPYIAGTGFYGTAGSVGYALSASPTPAATATSTAAAPPVGGIAEAPNVERARSQQPELGSSGRRAASIAGVAGVLAVAAGAVTMRRGRQRP